MEVKIQVVIDTYKEEIARVMNENVLLKAQVKQLQNEIENKNNEEEQRFYIASTLNSLKGCEK